MSDPQSLSPAAHVDAIARVPAARLGYRAVIVHREPHLAEDRAALPGADDLSGVQRHARHRVIPAVRTVLADAYRASPAAPQADDRRTPQRHPVLHARTCVTVRHG